MKNLFQLQHEARRKFPTVPEEALNALVVEIYYEGYKRADYDHKCLPHLTTTELAVAAREYQELDFNTANL